MDKRIVCVILSLAWIGSSVCEGGTLFIGQKAKKRIGGPRAHLSSKAYSVLILRRVDRDPIHLEPIDAIIFNTGGGTFKKKRTRDRDHIVLLDSPVGRPGEVVTAEGLEKYLTLIESNHMVPFVYEGQKGEELAVIYTDPYNTCYAYETPEGIRIDIKSPSSRHRSLEEYTIQIRKL